MRVWGCPAWVLDPRLQDGKKIPKWRKKSRLGMYLGISPEHSNTVGRILNLRTGYASPQYHVVYDELFTTVQATLVDELFDPDAWKNLIALGGLEQLLDPIDARGDTVPFQDFFDDFVDEADSGSDDETEPAPDPDPDPSHGNEGAVVSGSEGGVGNSTPNSRLSHRSEVQEPSTRSLSRTN